MEIKELVVENFMGLKGKHTLALSNLGLTHIAGNNQDDFGQTSNGACKTTILEALTYVLHGMGLPRPQGSTETGVKADEVLNDKVKKNCKVIATLQDNDTEYVIERWRKYRGTSGAAISINGTRLQNLDEKATNQKIQEELGISYDIWCRGVVYGQESAFNFCEATPKQREEMLTMVAGLEVIDSWVKSCREEKKVLEGKRATAAGKVQATKVALERVKSDDPEAKLVEWQTNQAEKIANLAQQLTEISDKGDSVNERIAILEESHQAVPTELVQLHESTSKEYHTFMGQVSASRASIEQYQLQMFRLQKEASNCPTCGQSLDTTQRDKHLAELASGLEAMHSEHQRKEATLQQIQGRLEQIRTQITEFQKNDLSQEITSKTHERDMLRQQWISTNERLEALKAEKNPYEGVKQAWIDTVQTLEHEIDEANLEEAACEKQIADCVWWDKSFPRLRVWLLESLVAALSAEANRWLKEMSAGSVWVDVSTTKQLKNKVTKDELTVTVHRLAPDGTTITRPYRTFSGGEKRRIGLAVDLALSRLMVQRASKPYSFLALDEIDRHLDGAGREGLRKVLVALKSERDTILVVTHDPTFRAAFDRELTVTKKGGEVSIV